MPNEVLEEHSKTVFEEFLLTEYSNLAQAHHICVNTMTAFFKHYLLIMSLPLSAIVLALTIMARGTAGYSKIEINTGVILGVALFLYIVGMLVMLYIITLRFRTLLYSRSVNGIRRYFVDKNPDQAGYFILPTDSSKPSYRETIVFGPVITTFAFVNTFYIAGAITWVFSPTLCSLLAIILLYIISTSLHWIIYFNLAKVFENRTQKLSYKPT